MLVILNCQNSRVWNGIEQWLNSRALSSDPPESIVALPFICPKITPFSLQMGCWPLSMAVLLSSSKSLSPLVTPHTEEICLFREPKHFSSHRDTVSSLFKCLHFAGKYHLEPKGIKQMRGSKAIPEAISCLNQGPGSHHMKGCCQGENAGPAHPWRAHFCRLCPLM